ncbi:high-affinity Zn(2+) transporter zrt1 [Ophidiomyces ophidiicola]|nr:high-affinity Zn(2+) transporter zrt1 [Ophidiomyces ophidiicola]KAI1961523.1 high-affinity Zn(2+) transporter zrt1 [Ophidiomyces ophidiicola]
MAPWTCLLLLATAQFASVYAQSYSNCHNHGPVQYCYGPDGKEVPVTTHAAGVTTPAPSPASASATPTSGAATTAITGCHTHATQTFCLLPGGKEAQITGGKAQPTPPAQYTGCHNHGPKLYCIGPEKEEVEVLGVTAAPTAPSKPSGESHAGMDCHFHAGVEHCVPKGGSEGAAAPISCAKVNRDYNVPYRIGSIFAILVTSAIGVFVPVLWKRLSPSTASSTAFLVIKQFGTGIMVATAFVHLLTHAQLMFANPCLGRLNYEATTTAILMAGVFLTFLMEFIGHRIMDARAPPRPDSESSDSNLPQQANNKDQAASTSSTDLTTHKHNHDERNDKLSVFMLEAGILFHSIILGLTLVVAGDSGYTPLFIVIIFHQMFEGLALGSRIAEVAETTLSVKLIMATMFALITPIGMAIGLGVRHSFNGREKGTIIAIGTLDAFSAGILTWASLVNMWSREWMHGEFQKTGALKTALGLLSLISGMVLMSILGKWA